MPVYSVVQSLPPHVVEDIARYVSPKTTVPLGIDGVLQTPENDKKLLPLMQTCAVWRGVVGSIFYHTTEVCGRDALAKNSWRKRHIFASDVIEIGAQALVKELRFDLTVPYFDSLWHKGDSLDTMISEFCDWPSVRSLTIGLNCNRGGRRDNGSADKDELDSEAVLKNVLALRDMFKQHIPNVWKVNIFRHGSFEARAAETGSKDIALKNIGKLIGADTGHLSLTGYKISNHIVSDLMPNTLRSLSISRHKGTQKHIELVRHNADTLESLCVDHITTHSMLKMTWGKNGGYHTQVYPRLKLLHIQFCVGQRNKTYRQPLADPFPRLQTLICRGHFPFSTPIVLTEGRSHIRHLDIDLDTDLLQTYADHRVFAKGSFPHLYYVSLGWAERDTTSRSYISMELYSMTVELCATAQIMRINSTGTTAKNDTMLKIHLATNLRVLDMPRHKVPFTELIPLLSGLPALQKARVVLGDVPTQNMLRMPTFEQINEYRELFKSHSTSAWALGISDLVFGNSRRAAEFLVLLVDILSSIKRVSISYNCTRTSYKVVNAVEFVKRRKIYKSNPAIEDVEFVSSASW